MPHIEIEIDDDIHEYCVSQNQSSIASSVQKLVKAGFACVDIGRSNDRQNYQSEMMACIEAERAKLELAFNTRQQLANERHSNELQHTRSQHYIELEALKHEIAKTNNENGNDMKYEMAIEENTRLRKEFQEGLEKVRESRVNAEISKLRSTIQEKDNDIQILRNSNFCKGVLGENAVRDILLDAFCDYAVKDMSGCATESDIHLENPSGEFLAIECKNKASITSLDVEKSIRDVTSLKNTYGTKFTSYLFLSLRTCNVPKRGYTFEVIDGKPVIWFGVSDVNTCRREILAIVKVALGLGQLFKAQSQGKEGQNSQGSQVDTIKFVKGVFTKIQKNVGMFKKIGDTVSLLQTQIGTITEANVGVLGDIETYLKQGSLSQLSLQPKKLKIQTIFTPGMLV